MEKKKFKPKPEWLKVKSGDAKRNREVEEITSGLKLNTVCREADCPNRGECFGRRTATFMILGKQCTRNCAFCCVSKGIPDEPDREEPVNIAKAVKKLDLKYAVITSVTRDDLPDGGSSHFAKVIYSIKEQIPCNTPRIEVLIPDFMGDDKALSKVVSAKPDVINHNLETVQRLYEQVRPQANYDRSLTLLERVKEMDPNIFTKSGIMVGFGETPQEVEKVFSDLRKINCDFITIGQYLPPSKTHPSPAEYITPGQFEEYEKKAYAQGFYYVASGPLVRSSYMAHEAFERIEKSKPGGNK